MLPNQIKPRTILIYGNTKSSKTTQAYFLCKWVWETYGLKTRYLCGDPGGYDPFIQSGMVEKGIVDLFDYTNRPMPLADIRRIAKGYWPRVVQGANGQPEEYFKSDEHCLTTNEEWSKIGIFLYEGLTSLGEIMKAHCSDQPSGSIGFKEAWAYEEDGEWFRGLQMGHYDLVQKEIRKLQCDLFSNLPVKFVVSTALLGKGTDKLSKETQIGPQMVGNATTPFIPSWFYDCFHLAKEVVPKPYPKPGQVVTWSETEEKLVAWFVNHPERDSGLTALAGIRTLPELFPELLKYFPYGYVPLGFRAGLDQFYKVLNYLNEKVRKENA